MPWPSMSQIGTLLNPVTLFITTETRYRSRGYILCLYYNNLPHVVTSSERLFQFLTSTTLGSTVFRNIIWIDIALEALRKNILFTYHIFQSLWMSPNTPNSIDLLRSPIFCFHNSSTQLLQTNGLIKHDNK